ncbi:hypothetical protein GFC29_3816 (plasmid) [Anoxybacillus sp. B7M1]|uniref:hypothetical protein n=1 Tax=Anoxybacillus sp. B7M1 TaxID=1490057 RepID=UPI0005CD5FD1|nr:hypothetical protein [Anoxybacillus sp. B7M1]ANB66169.1 hypothetical protein GFC29_3816 [Anoxybacillus sp. B7M1]
MTVQQMIDSYNKYLNNDPLETEDMENLIFAAEGGLLTPYPNGWYGDSLRQAMEIGEESFRETFKQVLMDIVHFQFTLRYGAGW